jgi:predicted acetyltransferase
MEYRPIAPAELQQVWRADEYCFFTEEQDREWFEHRMLPQYLRGMFDADGRLKAALANFPFTVLVEGARIGMGAVAGVASWPEYRREGNVGELMLHLLHEEKEKGVALSALYPFKQSFYRRYGWDVASAWLRHEIPLSELAPYRRSEGVIERCFPGEEDWRVLAELYAAVAARRNGFVVRETESIWKDWVNPQWEPPQYHLHTALWRPEAGARPEGYLLYRFVKDDKGERLLNLWELTATTTAAERGLLGFVAQHDSQVRAAIHRTPRDYPLWHLVENTKDVKSELRSGWMLRFVDMAAAFTARLWRGAPDASFTIGVSDDQLPWNRGTFRLTFEAGHAALVPAPAETPVLAADVRTWVQLYTGLIRPSQAVTTGRLTCTDPAALRTLEYATAGKEMWFYEFF